MVAWVDRYCSPTGAGSHDGTSPADAWDVDEAIAGHLPGYRVNFLGAEYGHASNLIWNIGATTDNPVWLRGTDDTWQPIDEVLPPTLTPGVNMPYFNTESNAYFETRTAYALSALAIRNGSASGCLRLWAGNCIAIGCRVETINTGANSHAYRETGGNKTIVACRATMAPGSTAAGFSFPGTNAYLAGVECDGGRWGVFAMLQGVIYRSIFRNASQAAVNFSAGARATAIANTFDNCPVGIELTGATTQSVLCLNNAHRTGTLGYDATSGSDENMMRFVASPFFYNVTTQQSGLMGDLSFWVPQEDASDLFDPDLTPQRASNAAENAIPDTFGTGAVNFADIGAVQGTGGGSGGGGGALGGGWNGGFNG